MKFEFAGEKPEGYFVKVPEWKLIPGSDGYMISRSGIIVRLPRSTTYVIRNGNKRTDHYDFLALRYAEDSYGYLRTALYKNGKRCHYGVHRAIAETFISNPENKEQVNHINGIKLDNRIENLEWATARENVIHAHRTGLVPKENYLISSLSQRVLHKKVKTVAKAKEYRRALNSKDIVKIRDKCKTETFSRIAKEYGVCRQTISNCFHGRFYQDVE